FFAKRTDFPVVTLRPTGVYGPRDKDYFLLTKTVRSGLNVSVGFKPQRITFIYVKDLVRAVYLAIEKAKPHSSYFVSDGEVYTSSDYALFVQKKLNVKYLLSLRIPLCMVWLISASVGGLMQWMGRSFTLNSDKFKIIKQRNWCCDNLPIEQDLGFKAEYKLQQGVDESIDWYLANGWL
ncbi:MAG TPA: NAD(P)-dependent oxidoreductase, partial [Bacteroidales bacterium]